MPRCSRCRQVKPQDEFVKNRSTKTGYGTYCKPCFNVKARESATRRHGSPADKQLKLRYGIDSAGVAKTIALQGGTCAVCRRSKPRHVDHDHRTGRVRGILCFNCNRGLGYFGDSIKLLFHAIDYVEPLDLEEHTK